MIGIFEDSFIKFLENNELGPIKIRSKNIVCRCPWCEFGTNKKHYHLNISIEAPIFHCLYAGCGASGTITKLFRKISNYDHSNNFVDMSRIQRVKKNNQSLKESKKLKLNIPIINISKFWDKVIYIKSRMRFTDFNFTNIPGLILDIRKFFEINPKIEIEENQKRMLDFYQDNFIGFLSSKNSVLLLRNINKSNFRYSKIRLNKIEFIDFYKIFGNNKKSNLILLAEGVFDILIESIFNKTKLKNNTFLYASCLSTGYQELIKSLTFHESIIQPDVVILSDSDVKKYYYENLYKKNKHLINSLKVLYNINGKDFAEYNVLPERII